MTDNNDKETPHFVTSHDFRGDALRQEKLHQLGAEIASPIRVTAILDKGEMLRLKLYEHLKN